MRHHVRGRGLSVSAWLRSRDPGLAATRRACRASVVASALFAVSMQVFHSPAMAYYAAFGCFSMLLFVEFTGPMAQRLRLHVGLAVAWAALVTLGTFAAGVTWLGVAATVVVAFLILLSGVVSSVIASSSTALLLAFVIPVTSPVPYSQLIARLAGVGLASCGSMLAIWLLWPRASTDPLSTPAIRVCRSTAVRLRDEAAPPMDDAEAASATALTHNAEQAGAAVRDLRRAFDSTPYRPTGLSTGSRALVRLVDELIWLGAVAADGPPAHEPSSDRRTEACAVLRAVADLLDRSAALLGNPLGAPEPVQEGTRLLRAAMDTLIEGPAAQPPHHVRTDGAEMEERAVLTTLDAAFRAKELGFAALQVAHNVQVAAAAERRGWFERLLGREPDALGGSVSSARARLGAHLTVTSVWVRNSLRAAVGLGIAVTLADITNLQHAFWILLGTLSALRSNALNTGQNALRAVAGTVVGSVVGAALLQLLGHHGTVLWFVLPVAVLAMGVAPTVISFAAGQAAFTVALVVVFSIGQNPDWHIALLRLQDVVLGCAVSLVVSLCLWPRGATAAVNRALAEAYTDCAAHLRSVVEHHLGLPAEAEKDGRSPAEEEWRAAAAARRLDDSFRTYLAERGAKPVSLAAMTTLVTGVARLRLMADALQHLWQRAGETRPDAGSDPARLELVRAAEGVSASYRVLATGIERRSPTVASGDPPEDLRLVESVYRDLLGSGDTRAHVVLIVWTSKYLEAARTLLPSLAAAASTADE
ncbi:FUSC family protein [Streptomyces sp. NPDC008092]|uniref:FUSC family protein n=1 Tax=Streptomyces sp. NPDC008092 TaxID=3364808 RepID=UPI0036E78E1C